MSVGELVPVGVRGWIETIGMILLILLGVAWCVQRDDRIRAEGRVESLTANYEATKTAIGVLQDSIAAKVDATRAADSLAAAHRDSIRGLRLALAREAEGAGLAFDTASDSLGRVLRALDDAVRVTLRPVTGRAIELHTELVEQHETQVAALLANAAEADSIAESWRLEADRWKDVARDRAVLNDSLDVALVRADSLISFWKREATSFDLGSFGLQVGGGVAIGSIAGFLLTK